MNIRSSDAKVVETTGSARKRLCQAACTTSGLRVRGASPHSTSIAASRFFRIRSAAPSMNARCRSIAARKSRVRTRVNSGSDQGEESSRASSRVRPSRFSSPGRCGPQRSRASRSCSRRRAWWLSAVFRARLASSRARRRSPSARSNPAASRTRSSSRVRARCSASARRRSSACQSRWAAPRVNRPATRPGRCRRCSALRSAGPARASCARSRAARASRAGSASTARSSSAVPTVRRAAATDARASV